MSTPRSTLATYQYPIEKYEEYIVKTLEEIEKARSALLKRVDTLKDPNPEARERTLVAIHALDWVLGDYNNYFSDTIKTYGGV